MALIPNSRPHKTLTEAPDAGYQAVRVFVGNGESNPIPVNVVDSVPGSPLNVFNEVTAVAVSTETDVLSYTVPVGKAVRLSFVDANGDNIAIYRVKVNGSTIAKKSTHVGGDPSVTFQFDRFELAAGDVFKITVENCSLLSLTGSFDGRLNGSIGDA